MVLVYCTSQLCVLSVFEVFSWWLLQFDWLIVLCLTPFSTVFPLYCSGICTYPCFPGVLLTSTPYNILSKPLAAFPHKHCLNNWQRWERDESCRNDYHQSSENILAELGIEPATCSEVCNATNQAMGLHFYSLEDMLRKKNKLKINWQKKLKYVE